ncbi:MAG TPA: hypothetical protein VFI54_06290 [Solirubrobacteraceae bacterium]|nr:hypothetical protein [Solirubrobacteraceae bacterium]
MREWLEDVRDHWNDPYWRLDHPELAITVASILTGIIGLLFAWLQAKLTARYQRPSTRDV